MPKGGITLNQNACNEQGELAEITRVGDEGANQIQAQSVTHSSFTSAKNSGHETLLIESPIAFDAKSKRRPLLGRSKYSELMAVNAALLNESPSVRVSRSRRGCESILWTVICFLCLSLLAFAMLWYFYSSQAQPLCETVHCIETSQKILSAMNFSVNPCDDFYSYACEGWIEKHHIPPGTNSWTVFSELAQTAEFFSKALLEDISLNESSLGLNLAQTYYASCMDEQTIDKLDLLPVKKMLEKRFGGWRLLPPGHPGSRSDGQITFTPETFDLTGILETNLLYNQGNDLFQLLVERDPRNSSRFVITLAPGVLSMQPEYYLDTTDPKILNIVEQFKGFMRNYSEMLGVKSAYLTALDDVFQLETRIANSTEPRARQNFETNYQKLTMAEMMELCPIIEWKRLFSTVFRAVSHDLDENETVIIGDKPYFDKRCKVYQEYLSSEDQIKTLHDAAVWGSLWDTIPKMPTRVRKMFEIYEQANTGAKEQPQRWLTCVRNTEEYFDMTIARKFVAEHFDETSKQLATNMIAQIKLAFKDSFHQVEWMDTFAKKGAEEKVDLMEDSIGYPDDINDVMKEDRTYAGITSVSTETYLENSLTLANAKIRTVLQKLFNDTSKSWEMAPHIVNAFYSPRENHIYFPAGILQKPFYDFLYPLPLNYGGIGVVVGHEIVHAFDRQGSKYDAKGNLRQWWSESTRTNFEKNSECMINQYGNYTVQGKNVDGHLTLSENIADNGGLKAAYRAYTKQQKRHPQKLGLPGLNFTMDQLFFISFAQVWCKRQLSQAAMHTVMFDVHAPERYRVIGTLSNSEEFSKAFKCKRGTPMNPANKCILW